MCHAGASCEDCSSSAAIGLSNVCKGVFNEASLTPWCHAMVHFEVKMSWFQLFHVDCPQCSGRWPVCHVGISNEGLFSFDGNFVCNEQDEDPAQS